MRTKLKNVPRIKLGNLLRRRSVDLQTWLKDNGIFTYDALVERCSSLGVDAPSQAEFVAASPPVPVSSPTDGIVVLSAPPVVEEDTGRVIEISEVAFDSLSVEEPSVEEASTGDETPRLERSAKKRR